MGVNIRALNLLQNCTRKTFQRYSHHIAAERVDQNALARQCEEVQIKVPWGHIAGKWWGTKSVRPILGMHGWQDNAGTFDTLAPLLPDHVGFLSIDLPGHGHSSRLPNGLDYSHMNYVYVMRLIMKEMKWDKISLIGHSLSSTVGFTFSSLFRDKVDMIVGLDILKTPVITDKERVQRLAKNMEGFLTADERNITQEEPPSYTYEECIERFYHGLEQSVDKDKCHYILDRNLTKSSKDPNKYYFHRDNRVKYSFGMISQSLCIELARNIQTVPYLFFKAAEAPIYEDEQNHYEILGMMKRTNTNFEYRVVHGTHHVHLNEPKKVAGLIKDFINRYRPIEST